jgi:immune inhibitor A
MSSGSYGNDGTEDIGSRPIHMGVWEKFQLGWINNYDVAFAGQASSHKVGPAATNTKQAQALFVVLPPKPVTSHIADPYEGSYFYYSGSANNLSNRMTKAVTLGAGATLTARVNYGIEEGYDYANVIVSTDGGTTWQTVPTNLSNSTVEDNGIEGFSNGWVELTANLPAGNVMVGFQYRTDGGVNYDGFMVDNIQISGYPLDGAEADAGWTFTGFRVTTGTEDRLYTHCYVAEFRQYRGYDDSLRTGPYNFGFLNTLPNWVEHFSYQDGLLISYWDNSQPDNNTPQHPGQGLILPIDAHPGVLMRPDNTPWRNRVQSYDSTFGLQATEAYTLHVNGTPSEIPSLPAAPVFNDSNSYWNASNPTGSVIVPNTGTTIRVVSYSAQGNFLQVVVNR